MKKNNILKNIGVIIPAYNEEKNVERLKLATNPRKFSTLAVVDATLALTVCPLCEASISKGAYVIVTESHNIFPCWNCEEFAILDLEPP